MVSQGKATWPSNTSKCYFDYTDNYTDPVLDVNNLCFNPSDYTGPVNASQYPQPPGMAATDFFANRAATIDDGNYGWSAELGADEYPLEIQCSSCFLYVDNSHEVTRLADLTRQRFIYGKTNRWGSIWEYVAVDRVD
jgi:hypothetical protein